MTVDRAAGERRLMAYMVGFRMGVCAAALVAVNRADEDLMAGYEAGRRAKAEAYRAASGAYGAGLNPLRRPGGGP